MASRVLKFESYAQDRFPKAQDAYRDVRRTLYPAATAESVAAENEGMRCAKGCLAGIGMEAVAALGLYGLWELWHLFR